VSLSTLETAILAELWHVSRNVSLKKKHLMEWSTTKIEPQAGEKYAFLPQLAVHVCYVEPAPKKRSR